MRADPDEHLTSGRERSRFPFVELVLAIAVIAGLVYYWYQWDDNDPTSAEAPVPAVSVPAMQAEVPATPDIPQRPEPVTESITDDTAETPDADDALAEPDTASPLTPTDANDMLRQQLTASGADAFVNKLMLNERPLDMSAAFLDGLGRGVILTKMIPGDPPKQAFTVQQDGDDLYMSPASYQRYDGYTDTLTALDSSRLVEMFHTLRPLYEQTFDHLGLDAGDFDNSVIRTLDLILATPEITEPIALKPKSVVYVYADPALESLPAVQKQLLRMGPDNLRRIKQQARALREGLLAQ